MAGRIQIDAAQFAALGALGTRRRYRPGTFLFREGDCSDHLVALLRGTVKVFATAGSGYESVLAVRSAGEIIGEFAAFDRRPRSASVIAVTDVDGAVIRGGDFRRYLRAEPDLALALLGELIDRVRESDRRRMEYGAYDATSRVSRLLLELAERHGVRIDTSEGPAVAVTLSQRDLAGAVGASREGIARILHGLRDRGAIVTGRLRIVILRPDLLRESSDPEPRPGLRPPP